MDSVASQPGREDIPAIQQFAFRCTVPGSGSFSVRTSGSRSSLGVRFASVLILLANLCTEAAREHQISSTDWRALPGASTTLPKETHTGRQLTLGLGLRGRGGIAGVDQDTNSGTISNQYQANSQTASATGEGSVSQSNTQSQTANDPSSSSSAPAPAPCFDSRLFGKLFYLLRGHDRRFLCINHFLDNLP